MTFQEFLMHGFLGHYAIQHLNGTAYAAMTGIAILLSMLSYFVGSLNFSIIISKRYHNDDIRNYGSGNAGTTNMLRTYGRRAAVLTLSGDALKAIVSTAYGYALYGFTGAYIAGFFCILGHCFPIYYRFKGGKGIVTVAFMVLMLDYRIFAILFVLFAILVLASKMVSFGSIVCIMLFPLILYKFSGPGVPILFAMLITVLVMFMHRENLKRISQGTESKLDITKLFGRKGGQESDAEEVFEAGNATVDTDSDEDESENAKDEENESAIAPASTAKKPHAISAAKKKRIKKQRDEERRRANHS